MSSPKISISRPVVGVPTTTRPEQRLAQHLYRHAQRWQDSDHISASRADAVVVVCISDTHNTAPANVPNGDILVHAGDLSQYGTFPEVAAQLTWLRQLPHKHKVVIAGNHDLLLDQSFVEQHPDRELDGRGAGGKSATDLDWGDLVYLEHSSTELVVRDRPVRIFGSPWTPRFGSWAFQYGDDENLWDAAVPEGTDIVVSHGPPVDHVDDGGKGCSMLLRELWRSRPTLVVCGHIHGGRGQERLFYDAVQRHYEDAIRNGQPRMAAWISVGKFIFVLILLKVQLLITGHSREMRSTQLVNAASVSGRGNQDHHDPIVVII
ncbi:phosphoric ester [Ophiostoma piceae UAMH 11346]|uniref:Phosphoric ester n=1 Tax=Ophiostoma piceae (strain UAMH 11346) TaxID=1262450 RepID=S3D3U5_OPHP1|nr:phosphoric ester [Ophiostoma piceae UAMH 11346]